MKSFLLFIAMLGVLVLGSSYESTVSSAASAARKEQAVMKFNDPVMLMGIPLKGEYLFVHDDKKMAREEACTYVYQGLAAASDKLVASFHCRPAIRARANSFIVRTALNASGQYELREYQFAGNIEAHRVPLNPHEGHINIAGVGN